MPNPAGKAGLEQAALAGYDKLMKLIGSMSEEERRAAFVFDDRDKNVRDVLVHLREWHYMLSGWVNDNMCGVKRAFLPAPYNWKTYPAMNVDVIWQEAQGVTLEDALKTLSDSHNDVMALMGRFDDEELFTRGHYGWIEGVSPLGAYFKSATSSHYDWAMKKLKRQMKELRERG